MTEPLKRGRPWPPLLDEVGWTQLIHALVRQRRHMGFSQEEVAHRMQVNEKLISRYECGDRRPSGYTLQSWARVLGCRLALYQPEGMEPYDPDSEQN